MSELNDLYQEVILDHNKNPHNYGTLEQADRTSEGHNPLCGDRLVIQLRLENGRIKDICFQGSGCSISKSACSVMTEVVKNKTIEEVEKIYHVFHQMITRPSDQEGDFDDLGELAAFSGVNEYPMRVKCASLAWHTLRAALQAQPGTVSTE